MPKIELETIINADVETVFDLSRSIDLHKVSTSQTKEEAISGKTKGLIDKNESVTWRARHLGFRQTLTSKVSAFDRPNYFVDYQVKGAFKSFKHQHQFEKTSDGTLMTDIFEYESPFGFLGQIANKLFLERYLTKFLKRRNQVIKEYAESEKWKVVLEN